MLTTPSSTHREVGTGREGDVSLRVGPVDIA